jgi:hypothetical protein
VRNVLPGTGEDDVRRYAEPLRGATDFGAIGWLLAADQQQFGPWRPANDFAKRLHEIELVLAVVDEAYRADHDIVLAEAELRAGGAAFSVRGLRESGRLDEVRLHAQRGSRHEVARPVMLGRAG